MAYQVKKRGLYDPQNSSEFRLSRSKIDLFVECPRCFYLDRRLGIGRPDMPAFTLNSAVDHLLKKEFDIHRRAKTPHPLMKTYKIEAIPFDHEELDIWRENFKGIQYNHAETNMLITGAIDDLWVNKKGELMVVDYKATSKDREIELENTRWHNQYRRQIEIYQWLLKQKGFNVSSTGYFVYVNGKRDREAFDGKLEFDVKVIPYVGKTEWLPKTLINIKKCLKGDLPEPTEECEYCAYRKNAALAAHTDSEKKKSLNKKATKKDQTGSLFKAY